MKIEIIKLTLALLLISHNPYAQFTTGNELIISGKVDNLPSGTKIYLISSLKNVADDTIQTTLSNKDGSFSFDVKKGFGQLHFIKIDTTNVKFSRAKRTWTNLILEPGSIRLESDMIKWPEATLSGAKQTQTYLNLIQEIKEKGKIITNNNPEKPDIEEYANFAFEKLISHPNSFATPLISLNMASTLKPFRLLKIYNVLTPDVKNTYHGKLLLSIVEYGGNTDLKLGSPFPEIPLEMQNGKTISITQLASKNNYTLIDFWASWCIPCRTSIPKLTDIYEQYKGKGFSIIGVSIDKVKNNWINALNQDKTPWEQLLDSTFICKDILGITAIPAYALIDKNGNIIAFERPMGQTFGPRITKDSLSLLLDKLLN